MTGRDGTHALPPQTPADGGKPTLCDEETSAPFVREKDLQAWVEDLVRGGALLSSIHNRDEVLALHASLRSADGLPGFPIDYLLRKRALESASQIMMNLASAELVSATANISSDRSSMYPDLLLFDARSQTAFILELKTKAKAEREAVTELLAYDHEFRNHLPFASNSDACLVVVANDFGTLLDHAVSSLLVWHNRRVLCLRPLMENGQRYLAVHLPKAWTAMGQAALSGEAIQTVTIRCFQPDNANDDDLARLWATLSPAFDFIVRDSERAGSHGFAFSWTGEATAAALFITIGVINPYELLRKAIQQGFLKGDRDSLVAWFAARVNLGPSASSLNAITERARELLANVCTSDIVSSGTWSDAWRRVKHQGRPIRVDFWGAPGDFAREMLLHPFLAAERRGEHLLRRSWQDPTWGIPFIHELCGATLFPLGDFRLVDVFTLGCQIAELHTVCNAIHEQAGDTDSHLSGLLVWLTLDLLPAIRAIAIRCNYASLGAPPSVVLGDAKEAEAMLQSLKALADWFEKTFLARNENHARVFRLGRLCSPAFVNYIAMDDDHRRAARAALRDEVLGIVHFLLDSDNSPYASEKDASAVRTAAIEACGLNPGLGDEALLAALEGHLDRQEGAGARLIKPLLSLMGQVWTGVVHQLGEPAVPETDWAWLRAQVEASRRRGKAFAGIGISEDGTISTRRFSDVVANFWQLDSETDVMVAIDQSFGTEYRIVRWEDLTAGRWWPESVTELSGAAKKWPRRHLVVGGT